MLVRVWFLFVVDTAKNEIEEAFNEFMKRPDIAIILISQYVSSCQ